MQRLGPDRAVKNEWLWKGMELLGIEVLNIGGNDVEELGALGIELKRNGRFISANLLSVQSGDPLLDPYVIKTVSPALPPPPSGSASSALRSAITPRKVGQATAGRIHRTAPGNGCPS